MDIVNIDEEKERIIDKVVADEGKLVAAIRDEILAEKDMMIELERRVKEVSRLADKDLFIEVSAQDSLRKELYKATSEPLEELMQEDRLKELLPKLVAYSF